jgi:hypothetical protein
VVRAAAGIFPGGKTMAKQISRDQFESNLSQKERDEFIAAGGTLYDGKESPVRPPEKPEYLISRGLYDSLSVGKEQALNDQYRVVIID